MLPTFETLPCNANGSWAGGALDVHGSIYCTPGEGDAVLRIDARSSQASLLACDTNVLNLSMKNGVV